MVSNEPNATKAIFEMRACHSSEQEKSVMRGELLPKGKREYLDMVKDQQ